MKVSTPPNWHALAREPLARALVFSACAHLALIALIQPSPGTGVARTVVINARLQAPEAPRTNPSAERVEAPARLPAPASPGTGTPAPTPPVSPAPDSTAQLVQPAPAPVSAPVGKPIPPATAAQAEPQGAPKPSAVAPVSGAGPERATSALPSLPLGVDTTWYQARQVDTQPRAIGKLEPAYPAEARRRDLEGSLRVMVKIDDLGRVQSAEVVEANPPGVFEDAALEAFRKARFQPAMKDGRPVRFQAYMRVDFKLED